MRLGVLQNIIFSTTTHNFRHFIFTLKATLKAATAAFSHRNSVRLSITRVDQSITVQAKITKS